MSVKVKNNNNHCCVPQCNSTASKNPSLSFHLFPNNNLPGPLGKYNAKRRQEWIRVLRIAKNVTHRMPVCSKHFKDSDYTLPAQFCARRRLKPTAVPSVNLPVTLTEDADCITQKKRKTKEREQRRKEINKFPSNVDLKKRTKAMRPENTYIKGSKKPSKLSNNVTSSTQELNGKGSEKIPGDSLSVKKTISTDSAQTEENSYKSTKENPLSIFRDNTDSEISTDSEEILSTENEYSVSEEMLKENFKILTTKYKKSQNKLKEYRRLCRLYVKEIIALKEVITNLKQINLTTDTNYS